MTMSSLFDLALTSSIPRSMKGYTQALSFCTIPSCHSQLQADLLPSVYAVDHVQYCYFSGLPE